MADHLLHIHYAMHCYKYEDIRHKCCLERKSHSKDIDDILHYVKHAMLNILNSRHYAVQNTIMTMNECFD